MFRHPAFWPIAITILALCASLACVWPIFERQAELAVEAEEAERQAANLRAEAENLRALLRLPPCEAKTSWEGSQR